MNSEELYNELLKFDKSNYNVILIDGPWGSGKTYLINRYIKNNKERLNIFYVSMLGKRNVDDINTSLYGEINKSKDIHINSIIPSAINALSSLNNDNNLDFVLKLDNNNTKSIIILDDLERFASSDYDSFLSYISNLILRGSKIICISNLLELGSGELYNFNLYKEKIFDKVYKAELFNQNVIDLKFGKYAKYLDSTIINLFNKNFRIVEKTNNFFNDVIKNLKKRKISLSYFDYKALLFYIVIMLNVYYGNKKLRLEDFLIRPSKEVINFNKLSFNEENDAWSSIFIYEYSINSQYIYKYRNDYIFIKSLLKAYLFSKFDDLINFYMHKEFTIEDVNKLKSLDLEMILKLNNLLNKENKDFILNKLFSLLDSNELINKFLNFYKDSLDEEHLSFFNELINKINSNKEKDFLTKLDIYYSNKDYDLLFDTINNNINLLTNEIDPKISEFLKDHNYLINNDIDEIYLLNYIEIIKLSSLKNDVISYIESLDEKTSLTNELLNKLKYIQEGISE